MTRGRRWFYIDSAELQAQVSQHGPQLIHWVARVREDGQRLFNGALPTVIQWGEAHPTVAMPDSGVVLQSLALSSPEAPALNAALQAIDLHTPVATHGAARLRATLSTPRWSVTLESAVI